MAATLAGGWQYGPDGYDKEGYDANGYDRDGKDPQGIADGPDGYAKRKAARLQERRLVQRDPTLDGLPVHPNGPYMVYEDQIPALDAAGYGRLQPEPRAGAGAGAKRLNQGACGHGRLHPGGGALRRGLGPNPNPSPDPNPNPNPNPDHNPLP